MYNAYIIAYICKLYVCIVLKIEFLLNYWCVYLYILYRYTLANIIIAKLYCNVNWLTNSCLHDLASKKWQLRLHNSNPHTIVLLIN